MKHTAYFTRVGLEIDLKRSDALYGSQQGKCDSYIEDLRTVPYIYKQLDKLDPDLLREELKEYGAWDNEELSDHETNLRRYLFLSCCQIRDDLNG